MAKTPKTAEEIQAAINTLDQEMDELRQQKDTLAKELDDQVSSETAATKVAALNDKERAALLQALTANGVLPSGGVGTPGE